MEHLKNIRYVLRSPGAILIALVLTAILGAIGWRFMDLPLLAGNMGQTRATTELVLFVIFLLLFGLFVAISVYKAQYFGGGDTKELSLGSLGGFLGMLVMGCPACSVTLASYIGLASVVSLLPYKGLELKVLGVLTLVYVIYSSLRSLHCCSLEYATIGSSKNTGHPVLAPEKCMKQHLYWLIFLQAIIATLGSLYYGWFGDPAINMQTGNFWSFSNGLTPCEMCRFARILMYPLVVIIGVGWIKKKFDYRSVLLLSGAGILLEAYQYRFQMTNSVADVNSFICGVGEDASCAATDVIYQGFITIPLLCLIAFIVIFVGTLKIRSLSKKK